MLLRLVAIEPTCCLLRVPVLFGDSLRYALSRFIPLFCLAVLAVCSGAAPGALPAFPTPSYACEYAYGALETVPHQQAESKAWPEAEAGAEGNAAEPG